MYRRTCCPGIIDGCAMPPVVLRACCVRLLNSGRWSLGGCACQPCGAATFIVELDGDGAALTLMPPPSIGRRPPRGVPGPTAGRPGSAWRGVAQSVAAKRLRVLHVRRFRRQMTRSRAGPRASAGLHGPS